jgi:protein-S-isoprenylcysteine O-methyltransferase Ste14
MTLLEMTTPITQAELRAVQFRRRIMIALGCVFLGTLLMFVDSRWRADWTPLYQGIEAAGVVLIGVCILGRTLCACYIGGRKKSALVQLGPYATTRNPLYVFSVLGAVGIGAQSGSVLVSLVFGLVTYWIFSGVIDKEEQFLGAAFGPDYDDYRRRVPRFVPNLALWRDADEVTIRPALVYRTFIEAALFLIAIPAAEIIEHAQMQGLLVVLARLP